MLGYIPGLIHAIYLISKYGSERCEVRGYHRIDSDQNHTVTHVVIINENTPTRAESEPSSSSGPAQHVVPASVPNAKSESEEFPGPIVVDVKNQDLPPAYGSIPK
ncbi:hypothetical protein AX774_g5830 [Zancudomyces culisetae]|uniref:Plasma membrane proteolipid 3 n=1 Tax=Zancudomyces culisetae TaxID=1213189 RepID=A0A1R1PIB4_ZANCU|nr:hypothetical protein AX774_g5830 [Zancudomyces culisetae]|eukprot:OMH80724.1 hypothetical protein AX774_g5830 [Zancudomyces culisetae]